MGEEDNILKLDPEIPEGIGLHMDDSDNTEITSAFEKEQEADFSMESYMDEDDYSEDEADVPSEFSEEKDSNVFSDEFQYSQEEMYAQRMAAQETAASIDINIQETPGNSGELVKIIEELKTENQQLASRILTMESTLSSLNNTFVKMSDSSEATARQLNQVNENLHKENQQLKEDFYESLVLPVLKDIIELSSDTLKDINRYRKQGDDKTAEAIESVLESIHLVLERHNVEAYQPKVGDEYEPIVQRILKTIETDDETKNKTIVKCSGFGYRFVKSNKEKLVFVKDEGNDKVLLPSNVYVYKLNK